MYFTIWVEIRKNTPETIRKCKKKRNDEKQVAQSKENTRNSLNFDCTEEGRSSSHSAGLKYIW